MCIVISTVVVSTLQYLVSLLINQNSMKLVLTLELSTGVLNTGHTIGIGSEEEEEVKEEETEKKRGEKKNNE